MQDTRFPPTHGCWARDSAGGQCPVSAAGSEGFTFTPQMLLDLPRTRPALWELQWVGKGPEFMLCTSSKQGNRKQTGVTSWGRALRPERPGWLRPRPQPAVRSWMNLPPPSVPWFWAWCPASRDAKEPGWANWGEGLEATAKGRPPAPQPCAGRGATWGGRRPPEGVGRASLWTRKRCLSTRGPACLGSWAVLSSGCLPRTERATLGVSRAW